MGELQRTLYRAELKKAQQQLLVVKGERQFQQERFHVLASLMRLRQICCDPALVFPGTRAPSAKLEAMDELLEPILAEGHKVLIFSQFTTLLRTVRQTRRIAAGSDLRADRDKPSRAAPWWSAFKPARAPPSS